MYKVLYRRDRPQAPSSIQFCSRSTVPVPLNRLSTPMEKLRLEVWFIIGGMVSYISGLFQWSWAVVVLISQQLETQASLMNFCETSQFFREMLTPLLFENIRLSNFSSFTTNEYYQFVHLPHLRHVKHLKVDMVYSPPPTSFGTFAPYVQGHYYRIFNDRLRYCLQLMPNLVSFSCVLCPLLIVLPSVSIPQQTASRTWYMSTKKTYQ